METKRIFLDIPSNVEVEKIEMTDSVLLRFIKEEKYEPKEGDICALDFMCSEGVKKLIFCLKSIRGRGCDSINYYFGINGGGDFGTGGYYGYQDGDTIRPATPEEQKQLFDALKENGKKWNAEKKCIEDIEQDVLVPEEINIIKVAAHRLGIVNRNQALYCSIYDDWVVHRTTYSREFKCKLVKCEWEDLEVGDVFYCADVNLSRIGVLSRYKIKLGDKSCVYWWDNSVTVRGYRWEHYYKVVPI